MTIVVGFVPTKEGRAALSRAVEEARLRQSKLVVINSNRGGRDYDDDTSQTAEAELQRVTDELRGDGLELEVRQLVRGNEPAEDLIAVANDTDADLIVIGSGPAGRRAATTRRTRWTRTTSAPSSTACRRPAVKASGSIGS